MPLAVSLPFPLQIEIPSRPPRRVSETGLLQTVGMDGNDSRRHENNDAQLKLPTDRLQRVRTFKILPEAPRHYYM